MSILNKYTKFFTLLVAVAAMTGCSEDKMDSINSDKDHPHSVPAKFTFADVITSTAQYNKETSILDTIQFCPCFAVSGLARACFCSKPA